MFRRMSIQQLKILSLDLGTQWTGLALSDPLGILAKPLTTVPTAELQKALTELFVTERISTVVVGNPKTLKGTDSNQTQLVFTQFTNLKNFFTDKKWVLWDERLSSKRASALAKSHSKEEKLKEHARAAAFILESYLNYLREHATENE
jgi:putative Holliday junction resolvase